jgi:hypothetical protein
VSAFLRRLLEDEALKSYYCRMINTYSPSTTLTTF